MIEKINKTSMLLVLRAFFALALMCSLSFAIGSLSVSPFSPSAGGAYGSQSNFATPAALPISAYAAPGYAFTGWVKNGNCTLYNAYAQNTTITVKSGSCAVTAFFAMTNSARASLAVSSSNPSAGTATGSSSGFLAPSAKQVYAVATASGYSFSSWATSGNCSMNPYEANGTVIIFSGTCYATAVFNQTGQAYASLTVISGTGGTASGSASNFSAPAVKQISATPNVGYNFANWIKSSGDCSIANSSLASTDVTVNLGRCTVAANFAPKPIYASLDVSSLVYGYGTVTGSESNFAAPANKLVAATPAFGYFFLNWTTSGNCTAANKSAASTYVRVISGTCYAFANFAQIGSFANLTVNRNSFEMGTATGSATNIVTPSTRPIVASPYAGYIFGSWSRRGNCTVANTSKANTTVEINSGGLCQVTANFITDPTRYCNINVSVMPREAGGVSVYSQMLAPTSQIIAATPLNGYKLASWGASGSCRVANATSANTTLYMDPGACSLTANFARIVYANLQVLANPSQLGSVYWSASNFSAPATKPLAASALSGYRLSQWISSGDCAIANATSGNTTVTVNSGTCAVTGFFGSLYSTGYFYATTSNSSQGYANGSVSGAFAVPAIKAASAVPARGYEFNYWGLNGGCMLNSSGNLPNVAVQINGGSCTATAYFRPIPVYGDLYASSLPSEGGFAAGSSYNFSVPATKSLRAEPSSGYSFSNWSSVGNCTIANASLANTTVAIASGACNITGYFIRSSQTYGSLEIAASPAGGGTVPSSEYDFVAPAAKPLSATPFVGYYFFAWQAYGNCTIADANSTFTNVTVNSGTCTVKAFFAKKGTGLNQTVDAVNPPAAPVPNTASMIGAGGADTLVIIGVLLAAALAAYLIFSKKAAGGKKSGKK